MRSVNRIMRAVWMATVLSCATGCTPKYDWRILDNEEFGWVATFPAKPVEVTRRVAMEGFETPVGLTLKSARIDNTMFAVGWVAREAAPPGSTPALRQRPADAEKIRKALQQAMLKNLDHDAQTIKESEVVLANQLSAKALFAKGKMRLNKDAPAIDAVLWMRSQANPNARLLAIEIIAVGPSGEIPEEIALQFIESLRLK